MGNILGYENRSDEINQIRELQQQLEELRRNKAPLESPWREDDSAVFSQEMKDKLLQKIKSIELPDPCQAINLIVVGRKGSGKSSFVNTLFTVLRNSSQISTIAASYGVNYPSTTNSLHEITLLRNWNEKQLRIYDCRGVETPNEYYEKDLIKTISGCIKKDYKFQTANSIRDDSIFLNQTPTISDKMHCVLFVASADQDFQKDKIVLANVQKHLREENIPLRLIFTKVDKLELCGSGEVSEVFRSRHAYQKVNKAKGTFGLQDNQILPIASYVRGTTQNLSQDVLALLALENILEEAVAYIKHGV